MTFILYNELSEEDFFSNKMRLGDEFETLLPEISITIGFVPVIIHRTIAENIKTLTINETPYCSIVEDGGHYCLYFTYKTNKFEAEFPPSVMEKVLEGEKLFLFTNSNHTFKVLPVRR